MLTIFLLHMTVTVLLISVAMLLIASTLLLCTVVSMMTAAHTVFWTHLLVSLILVFRKDVFQFLFISRTLFKALFHLSFLLISELRTLSAFFVLTSTLVHLRA